jgi:putative ABC transport system permease protein
MLLAIGEITRAKARFGLLAGAIGLLVFLILFQQALLSGLVGSFIGAIENQNSPVLAFGEQARKNVEASFLSDAQAAAVADVGGVAESGLIGQNTYTVDAGGELKDGVLFGYELGGLGEPLTLTEGRLPEAPNEGVASSADADAGFGLGETVKIVGDDGPEITIVGLGDSLRWSVAPTVFVSYETYEAAQRAVNPNAETVLPSLVAAAPVEGVSESELAGRINAEVAGVEALTNQQAVDENPGVQGVNQSFQIILVLAFLVATLVIGFFFLILTVQKAKPLTLLRAIGAPASYLVRNLLAQILAVLLAGIVLGCALLVLVRAVSPSGDVEIELDPQSIIITLVALAALSFIGGFAAIRRLLRIEPIRATRAAGRQL